MPIVILGVDPGSTATGYGIVRKSRSKSSHIASGVIRCNHSEPYTQRLHRIYEGLEEVILLHKPEVMVVESFFHAKNSQTLIKLSQVRGVVLLLAPMHGLEFFEYSPMEIKRGLVGYGRAEKEQVIFMVSNILGLTGLKSADQADALAVALYHSSVAGFQEMIR